MLSARVGSPSSLLLQQSRPQCLAANLPAAQQQMQRQEEEGTSWQAATPRSCNLLALRG